jgi:DNA mismatch repair protein MutL
LELGFELERWGQETIILRRLPALLQSLNTVQLIKDLLADYQVFAQSQRAEHCKNELLATMACRAALRANTNLTLQEINDLLRELEQTQNGGVCNHGRPTWQQFTLADLDRFFLRGR